MVLLISVCMQAINEKILSLDYGEYRAELKTVDAQESFNGGVTVLVTGYLTGKDNVSRNFTQSFFLAPQDKGYFVLNDIFRYMEDVSHPDGKQGFGDDVQAPVTPDQGKKNLHVWFTFFFSFIFCPRSSSLSFSVAFCFFSCNWLLLWMQILLHCRTISSLKRQLWSLRK